MSAFRKTVSAVLMAAMLLLIVLLPRYASGLLGARSTLDWLIPKQESFSGVITCWHVVRFKPYSGSMGAWLEKYAKRMEKRHFGVYFEVESITEAEAARRSAAGLFPDIISFPKGFLSGEELLEMPMEAPAAQTEAARSLALAASCELLLFYPEKTDEEGDALVENAKKYSFEEFKSGKAPCCIADARGAGDMQRLLAAGKADYFDILPFKNETELVQFVGLSASIANEKLPYALEFIELITGEAAQGELATIGLMPMNEQAERVYEQSFLADAYRMIERGEGAWKNAFD